MKYIKTSSVPRVDDPTLNRALEMMDEELAKIARVFIDWTADAGANNIHDNNILSSSITQHQGDIDHNALTNFVENKHIDHSGVSISAGTGLSGGGTIAANRTINLSHLGIESLADPGADRILFWDESEDAFKWLEVIGSGLTIWGSSLYWSWLGLDDLAEDPANESILWFSGPVGGLDWGNIGTGLEFDTGTLKTKDSEIVHDNLSGFVAAEHKSLPNTIAQVLSDHNLGVHTALGLFDQSSDVDHNATTNYTANRHLVLPNTIASVLSDHNLATHNALAIDHGSLSGRTDDDHTIYYNAARHTKAVHNALNITQLGTVGTGVWQGTAIANAYIAGIDQNLLQASSPTFNEPTISKLKWSAGATPYITATATLNRIYHDLQLFNTLTFTNASWSKAEGRIYADPLYLHFGSYYLNSLVANNKVPDSDKWDGYQFANYLNQAVKTTSNVIFNQITLGGNKNLVVGNYTLIDTYHYSTTYRYLRLGILSGTRGLSLGVDISGNASGSFGGNEIIFPHNIGMIAPNAANNSYIGVLKVINDTQINIGGLTYAVAGWLKVSPTGITVGGAGDGTVTGGTKLNIEAGATGVCSDTIFADTTAYDANVNIQGVEGAGWIKRSTSAKKYKDKITDLELDSSLLYNLRPVSFNSKCEGAEKNKRFIGLIADEIEKIYPEIIHYNKKHEAESYDNQMLMTLMLAETQHHEARIKALEAKLNN